MINLLFVCMGNICRSPVAEGVMKHLVEKNNLEDEIFCDSAGTIGHHIGEMPDSRMRVHAEKRGISLTSRARQFDADVDFEKFDYIFVMDKDNYRDIAALDSTGKYASKIHMMTDFASHRREKEVPDPYYGGAKAFEHVINIVEDAAEGILEHILGKLKS